jgi:hypothetical protein
MSGMLESRYYSNPFWKDDFDPQLDPDAAQAGALGERAKSLTTEAARDRTTAWITWFLAGVVLPIIIWLAPGESGYADGQGRGSVLFGFIVVLAVPVVAVVAGGAKSRAVKEVKRQRERHLEQTFLHSCGRYQLWFENVAASDRQLYFQVVSWHQASAANDELQRLANAQRANTQLLGLLGLIGIAHLNQHRDR